MRTVPASTTAVAFARPILGTSRRVASTESASLSLSTGPTVAPSCLDGGGVGREENQESTSLTGFDSLPAQPSRLTVPPPGNDMRYVIFGVAGGEAGCLLAATAEGRDAMVTQASTAARTHATSSRRRHLAGLNTSFNTFSSSATSAVV